MIGWLILKLRIFVLCRKAKKLFFKDKEGEKNIFEHKADGTPCAYCNKPMLPGQSTTRVGNGDKMHSECWSPYFKRTVEKMAEKYQSKE